jgi:two-component sensor histidine kinase
MAKCAYLRAAGFQLDKTKPHSSATSAIWAGLPPTGSAAALVLVVAVIALAGLAKPLLDNLAQEMLPPYITFYPAVVIAALLAGPRVGVLSAVATLLIAWFFFVPAYNSFVVPDAAAAVTLAIYAVTSILLGIVVGSARLAHDEARASEARRDHAAREAVHRIKNLVAVVQAIARKVAREVQTTEDYRKVLSARLAALDTAQSVLVRRDWQAVDLGEIIDSALAPFLPNPGLKLLRGPAVTVPARHVAGLCMALYELCTNAMKYGALAEGRGPVTLSWRTESDDIVLEWTELTPTQAQRVEGFGTQLVRIALSDEPSTNVDYLIEPERVHAVFTWRQEPVAA